MKSRNTPSPKRTIGESPLLATPDITSEVLFSNIPPHRQPDAQDTTKASQPDPKTNVKTAKKAPKKKTPKPSHQKAQARAKVKRKKK